MKYLLILTCLLFSAANSFATDRTIHIEWGYTPPSSPAVTGYVLYMEGVKVCTFPGATITAGDCAVSIIKQSTVFTLTAAFDDATESPHSAPFTFVLDVFNKNPPKDFKVNNTSVDIPTITYSNVTFKWEMTDISNVKGYKFFINNQLVCETTDVSITEYTCKVPTISSEANFSIATVLANNEESNKSNTISYIP